MPAIEFSKDNLGEIVRNRKGLHVPVNQRSYAWKRSHVEDLFKDLNGAITQGAEEYFLGSVIVVNPSRQVNFIEDYDGQQRIATTMILIAAIRDFFWSVLKDEKIANVITRESLLSLERTGLETPHFTLSAADQQFFVFKILKEPESAERRAAVPDPKKESHELIVEAAKVAADHVTAITNNLPADVQRKPFIGGWIFCRKERG